MAVQSKGLLCVLCVWVFGCTAEVAPFNAQPTPEDLSSDAPDTGWGHGEGSMPPRDNIDVGRSGAETHLSYWGKFWKTPGVHGVTAYTVYDTTVAGQIIMTSYDSSGNSAGEQECHYIVGHVDEATTTGYNSYLILQNVAGGATPYTYIAAYKNSAVLYLCPARQANGTVLTFASSAEASADIAAADEADETKLTTTGCNTDTRDEAWTFTSVQGGSNVCGDGIVGGSEECDDGNYVNGDGSDTCYNTCRSETRPSDYAIAAGHTHTCALSSSGAVKCWGDNTFGKLGQGNTTNVSNDADPVLADLTPVALGWATGTTQAIATGDAHTCALSSAGAVKCWGFNASGQLGQNNTTNVSNDANPVLANVPPVAVGTGFGTVVAIAAGTNYSCALSSGGLVKCWGGNDYGQLGQGNITYVGDDTSRKVEDASAVALGAGFEIVVAITIGNYHTCALSSGGAVKCWGNGGNGKLGQGNSDNVSAYDSFQASQSPVAIGWSSGVVTAAIAAGEYHTCALSSAGEVKCWGANTHGALGQGDTVMVSNDDDPVLAEIDPVTTGWSSGVSAAIATGEYHTCALSSGGLVKCWGYNAYGQLGQGNTYKVSDGHPFDAGTDPDTPADVGVDGISPVALGWSSGIVTTAIAAGRSHSCALSSGDSVKCWGRNQSGQLGQGNITNVSDDSDPVLATLPVVAFGSGW